MIFENGIRQLWFNILIACNYDCWYCFQDRKYRQRGLQAGRIASPEGVTRLRQFLDQNGTWEVILVGTGELGDGPDGDPRQCRLARPHGVFVDGSGNVYIGDSENYRVRMCKPAPSASQTPRP